MSGYVCIAMLEDPPYSIYLAATEEEPEDWCAGLELPSHLLCYEAFEDPQAITKQCIRELKAEGVEARTYIAFSAKPWEVFGKFMAVRDKAKRDDQGMSSVLEDEDGGDRLRQIDYDFELVDENGNPIDKSAALNQLKEHISQFVSGVSVWLPPSAMYYGRQKRCRAERC